MISRGNARATALVIRLGALLSARPAAIIYNSVTSAQQHEALGYRHDKRVILPNGFDCEMFRPRPEARSSFRRELGVADDSLLVGLIARCHPMKDHAAFLRAAAIIRRSHPKVWFVLAGSGVSRERASAAQRHSREGLDGGIFLLGERKDTARINAALDIACSSSAWGEGFSNSIGEAMACAFRVWSPILVIALSLLGILESRSRRATMKRLQKPFKNC